MKPRSSCRFLCLFLLLLPFASAQAEFNLVDDFESFNVGPINGHGGWTASSDNSVVTLDPIHDANRVLSVTTDSSHLFRNLLMVDGTTRMMFLRFRMDSQLSCSFGLSDVVSPDRFDHFETELSLTNAPAELRINDDGFYEVLTPLDEDVWYNCWILIDNERDETQIWMHSRGGEPARPSDKLEANGESVFDFRNGTNDNDLQNFYIKTSGGHGVAGPLYIDDIYLEDSSELNLTYPFEVPADVAGGEDALSLPVIRSYPNPFRSAATIRFRLATPGDVELTVFDSSGRRVIQLIDELLPAREHELTWGGGDSSGQTVSAGFYIVRLRTANLSVTERLIRVN